MMQKRKLPVTSMSCTNRSGPLTLPWATTNRCHFWLPPLTLSELSKYESTEIREGPLNPTPTMEHFQRIQKHLSYKLKSALTCKRSPKRPTLSGLTSNNGQLREHKSPRNHRWSQSKWSHHSWSATSPNIKKNKGERKQFDHSERFSRKQKSTHWKCQRRNEPKYAQLTCTANMLCHTHDNPVLRQFCSPIQLGTEKPSCLCIKTFNLSHSLRCLIGGYT